MHRTEGDQYVDIGGGRRGYLQNQTVYPASSANAIQEEICHAIEYAGLIVNTTAATDQTQDYVQLKNAIFLSGAITGAAISSNTIDAVKLKTADLQSPIRLSGTNKLELWYNTGHFQTGASGLEIKNDSIINSMILNSTITGSKLTNSTIGNDKLAVDSVQTNVIQNSAVTNAKLAIDSVTNDKILSGTISISKFDNDARLDYGQKYTASFITLSDQVVHSFSVPIGTVYKCTVTADLTLLSGAVANGLELQIRDNTTVKEAIVITENSGTFSNTRSYSKTVYFTSGSNNINLYQFAISYPSGSGFKNVRFIIESATPLNTIT